MKLIYTGGIMSLHLFAKIAIIQVHIAISRFFKECVKLLI